MEQKDFWKLFAETGEPVYWLLCRGAQNQVASEHLRRLEPGTDQPNTPPTPS